MAIQCAIRFLFCGRIGLFFGLGAAEFDGIGISLRGARLAITLFARPREAVDICRHA